MAHGSSGWVTANMTPFAMQVCINDSRAPRSRRDAIGLEGKRQIEIKQLLLAARKSRDHSLAATYGTSDLGLLVSLEDTQQRMTPVREVATATVTR